jgi:polar amino acid transport system ATP-binding protein
VKNQVPYSLAKQIHLAYEEAVHQCIVCTMTQPKVHLSIEYSPENERAAFVVDYNGSQMDIFKDGDDISVSILKKIVSDVKYSYNNDQESGNHLVFFIS